MFARFARYTFLLTLVAVLSSCSTWDDPKNTEEQLPWNTPQQWEGQGMSLPY